MDGSEIKNKYSFDDFCKIIDVLMGDNGCPWDRVQTHETLRPCLIEECYETVDAIDKMDMSSLKEELGDVLLQVVLHSKISEKNSCFTLDDVIDGVSQKMINRHRHVSFDIKKAEVSAPTPEEALKSWDSAKKEEKGNPSAAQSMRDVPKCLPALMRAYKIYKYADRSITADQAEIIRNIYAELENLQKALDSGLSDQSTEFSIGRIAFNLVIISRFLQINPEFALTNLIETFITKFEHNEGHIGGDSAFQDIYASFF